MPAKIHLDIDRLRHLIEVETLTHQQVGQILGASSDTIARACKRHGVKTQRTGPRGGERHPEWKGGRQIDADGYVLVWTPPGTPGRRGSGYILEHRMLAERRLGRHLKRSEVVHHVNGDKQDNRLENLVVFENNANHLRHELADDAVHALCVGCRMRRSAILDSLAGGDPLPLPVSRHSKTRRDRLVRKACEQLQLPLPAWFSGYVHPTTKPRRQPAPRRPALSHRPTGISLAAP